jgi:hypothetical protein
MDMQDKEFDNVFRAKLDSFEAEPTGQVWYGITEGLDGKRHYRALLPWLSIAASITVLVAAGLLFMPKKGADHVKPGVKPGIAKTMVPVVVKQDTAPAPHKEIIKSAAPVLNNQVNSIAYVKPAKAPIINKADKPETTPVSAAKVESVIKQQEEPILAVVDRKPDIIIPVVPATSTQLIAQQTIDIAPAENQSAVAVNTLPVKPGATQLKPKRRVHGIGGFLNTVIAAVDKRKDKIIEFSNSDDDESSNITAINLGVLKFKKEEAK